MRRQPNSVWRKLTALTAGGVLILFMCVLSCGCVGRTYEMVETAVNTAGNGGKVSEADGEMMPSVYDSRADGKRTGVKNQGSDWECWAYASLTALEASLLPEKAAVFSVNHMVDDGKRYMGGRPGGNYMMSVAYLLSWRGPVVQDKEEQGVGFHVKEVQILEGRDVEAIKKAVFRCGAAVTSFHSDFAEDGSGISKWYQPETASYACLEPSEINHDVVIIGWDDAYPKENFLVQPERDGAFLCQNSWGEAFGKNGCFYVSYEDAVIGTYAVAYSKAEDANPETCLYETDSRGWSGRIGYETDTMWCANVYQAERNEQVESVGCYFQEPDVEYEVYLVNDWEQQADFSKRVLLAEGVSGFSGYTTISLEELVPVSEDERFAVMVKWHSRTGNVSAAVEVQTDEYVFETGERAGEEDGESETAGEQSEVKYVSSSGNQRERFQNVGYVSWDGEHWENVYEKHKSNLCLKAYTTTIIRG